MPLRLNVADISSFSGSRPQASSGTEPQAQAGFAALLTKQQPAAAPPAKDAGAARTNTHGETGRARERSRRSTSGDASGGTAGLAAAPVAAAPQSSGSTVATYPSRQNAPAAEPASQDAPVAAPSLTDSTASRTPVQLAASAPTAQPAGVPSAGSAQGGLQAGESSSPTGLAPSQLTQTAAPSQPTQTAAPSQPTLTAASSQPLVAALPPVPVEGANSPAPQTAPDPAPVPAREANPAPQAPEVLSQMAASGATTSQAAALETSSTQQAAPAPQSSGDDRNLPPASAASGTTKILADGGVADGPALAVASTVAFPGTPQPTSAARNPQGVQGGKPTPLPIKVHLQNPVAAPTAAAPMLQPEPLADANANPAVAMVTATAATAPQGISSSGNGSSQPDGSSSGGSSDRAERKHLGDVQAGDVDGARVGMGGWLTSAQPAGQPGAAEPGPALADLRATQTDGSAAATQAAGTGMAQVAMDRVASESSARRIGAALQSDLLMGVQTDAFGRVHVQTTMQGGQLAAQIFLEHAHAGTAALATQVPVLEARLGEKFHVDASVSVRADAGGSRQPPSQNSGGGAGSYVPLMPLATGARSSAAGAFVPVSPSPTAHWSAAQASGRLDITI